MRTCACVLETYVRTDSTIYIYTAWLLIEHPREWLALLADKPILISSMLAAGIVQDRFVGEAVEGEGGEEETTGGYFSTTTSTGTFTARLEGLPFLSS